MKDSFEKAMASYLEDLIKCLDQAVYVNIGVLECSDLLWGMYEILHAPEIPKNIKKMVEEWSLKRWLSDEIFFLYWEFEVGQGVREIPGELNHLACVSPSEATQSILDKLTKQKEEIKKIEALFPKRDHRDYERAYPIIANEFVYDYNGINYRYTYIENKNKERKVPSRSNNTHHMRLHDLIIDSKIDKVWQESFPDAMKTLKITHNSGQLTQAGICLEILKAPEKVWDIKTLHQLLKKSNMSNKNMEVKKLYEVLVKNVVNRHFKKQSLKPNIFDTLISYIKENNRILAQNILSKK